jgi:pentatricopeptide repeat protein
VEFGYNEKALNRFDKMQLTGVRPNAFTYVFCLRACGTVRDEQRIRGLHDEIQRRGFLNKDCVIGNTLVDLYAKGGLLLMAQDTFDNLHVRDTVAWTSLIAGYAEHGMKDEALNCFEHMQLEGVPSSAISCISALKACGLAGSLYKGREIHVQIERQGLLQSDIVVGNTLVNMYAKFGCLPEAQEVFNKLPQHNVASWTALMGAHNRHENDKERLAFFEELQHKGVMPDTFLFVHSLKLCGNIGALSKGNEIYADIERRGCLERGIVGNAIVDMYAKAGLLINAVQVFGKLPSKDVVAWTALMAGYVQHGASDYVFAIFDQMREDGVTPDEVTFTVVLHACQCSGQLKKGYAYFEIMSKEYGICPMHKHKASLVNLRGCLGQLYNTVEIAADVHLSNDLRVWHALLDSCRHWGNLEIGEAAFKHAVSLDQSDAVAYSLMSHMYATAHVVDGRMQ